MQTALTITNRPPPAPVRRPSAADAAQARLLQELATFRTIWALCDLRRADDGSEILNASHFAACLTAGREPLWALFNARTGRIERWFGGRHQIEDAFPRKVWRRKTSTWSLGKIEEPLERDEIVRRIKAQKVTP